MIDTFNGALTLNQTLLYELRESPHAVRRGMLVVLLVGLLVGGVNGVRTFMGVLNPDREFATLREAWFDMLDQQALAATAPEQREAVKLIRENIDPAFDLARTLNDLPVALPQPAGALFQGLGVLVSQPLSYLSGLLIAVIFTHIAARWLGGQGNIQQMLGLGALSVAPHALDALTFVPFLGSAFGLIAWGWGLVILIVSAGVAHRLDNGRAAIAVAFFPAIGGILALLGLCALLLVSAMTAGLGA